MIYFLKDAFFLKVAFDILNDLDLRILAHRAFGKGFVKTCRVGPDAFIQMALQLAYYRVNVQKWFTFIRKT